MEQCGEKATDGNDVPDGSSSAVMLAITKIHRDHTLAKYKAVLGTKERKNYQTRTRQKKTADGKDGERPSLDKVGAFRKHSYGSFSLQPLQRDDAISQTARQRSTVVPIVKKRVEMLNMNTISREFMQAMADDEDVKLALARKEGQARDTWEEICAIPYLPRAQAVESPRAGATPAGVGVSGDKDDRNNDEADLPAGTRWMVHAHAPSKVKWDLMVAVLIVYSTLIVPFRIGFDRTASALETAMDAVVDIVFAADIAASFRTAFVDENGDVVVDAWEIGLRYLKSWFIVDFLSTVPLDFLALYVAGQSDKTMLRSTKMIRTVRLVRLFKLVRFLKLQIKVGGEIEIADRMNPSVISLLKMFIYMTFIAHILGCLWHWIVTFEDDGINWVSYFGVEEASVTTRYVASIYWAFTTMTTVGYGDVVVTTALETGFCIVGMLIGATVFGYIVGNVSVMMENLDLKSAVRTQKMDRVKEYIISRRFPQKLSRRILDQYKYHYKRVSVLDNYAILESLPTTARTSLLFAQYHDAVDNVSFLQNNPPLFVTRLVGCLTACHAKLGDVLFYQNEMGSDLYFLVTGKVNLLASFNARPIPDAGGSIGTYEVGEESYYGPYLRQTFTLEKVFKGSMVGEAGLMLDLQQPCAAVSMAVCDLFTVGKEDLLSTLIGYAEVQARLVDEAKRFMKRVEEFKKSKGAEPESGEETDESSMSGTTDGVGRDLLGGTGDGVSGDSGTDGGKGRQFEDSVCANSEEKMATTVGVTQSPSLLQSPPKQAMGSTVCSAMVLPLPDGGASSPRTSPGHQLTDVTNKLKPLSCVLVETTKDTCPSGLGGRDSNTCSDGRSGSENNHGQGAGGLLDAATFRLKNGGDDSDGDGNGNSSDSDVELVGSQLEERGKLERHRQSLATKQIKDLTETAVNEAASGSMADSSIIHRLSTTRSFRKSSTIHPVSPKEGDMNYLKGLKRTTSGAMEGSPTQKNVAQAGRNGSNNTKSGGKTNRDVGNVRDLDGFNDKDSTKTHLRGSRDSDLVRTPADQNGSHSEPQEPFTCSRSTITAAGAPPSSLQPGPHPHSGEGALLVHPSPAGRHQKGASSDRRKSLVDALREINPGARLRKVLPVGANGAAVGGPAALKANGNFSQASSSSPHRHAPILNELDGVMSEGTEEEEEDEEESNKRLRRKNIISMIFHRGAKSRLQMRTRASMAQLALNDFSPHLIWGRLLLIHPDSIWKAIWDVFVAVLIVFSVVEVTFRLGFQAPAEGSWAMFNYVVDALFLVDMVLSFNTAYWNDGNIVTVRKSIARNYFRTWFMVDLVSTMPMDALFSTLVQNSDAFRGTKLIRVVRLVRLFKIFRLLKMSTFFERYQDAFPLSPSAIRLTKLVVLMSFAAHVAACVWYTVGVHSIDNDRGSWILDYCVSDGVYSSCLNDQPLGSRYMSSLYWAFTTMTTVGYGDIAPANNIPEMMTALVSEVAGTTLFAYVIGALVNIVLNLDPQTRLRKQKVEYLSEYMRDFNMTQAQKVEMRRHLKFMLSFNSVFPEMEILATLPSYLRIPAVLYSYRAALPRLPLLCKIEMEYPGFLSIVLPRLRPGEYLKGDLIVSPRLCAQEMGFVLHGMCEGVSSRNGQTIEIYREGQCLGEATLLIPDGVSFGVLVEVRALMRVEMLMLHKVDFDWMSTNYPPPIESFRDEITDWEKVLQWISLPKVYTKKIQRIVQRAAVLRNSRGRSPSFADVAIAATSMDTAVTAAAAIASSARPHGMEHHGMGTINSDARSSQTTGRDSRPPAGCRREAGKGNDRENLVSTTEREKLDSPTTRQQRGFGGWW